MCTFRSEEIAASVNTVSDSYGAQPEGMTSVRLLHANSSRLGQGPISIVRERYEGPMKKKAVNALCVLFGAILGFSTVALIWGILFYRSMKTQMADICLSLFRTYAYVQYRQAGPRQAKEALVTNLRAIEFLRAKHIRKLDTRFEFEAGLTDLRLFHMAVLAGSKEEADEYMRKAQSEAAKLGWADTSSVTLARLIEARESKEQQEEKEADEVPSASIGKLPEAHK
jgi:hypothetical protein